MTAREGRICPTCGAPLLSEPDLRVQYWVSQLDASGRPRLQSAAVLGRFKCRACGAWSEFPVFEVRADGQPG